MTKLFYNVEIKCYPAPNFKLTDFVSFIQGQDKKIVTKIAEQLFFREIQIIDAMSGITKFNSISYIIFSLKGRAISYEDFHQLELKKKKLEKNLSKELSFFPSDLSITVYFEKMSILSYYIVSLKFWFLSRKKGVNNILVP